jgi:hypothetical protein
MPATQVAGQEWYFASNATMIHRVGEIRHDGQCFADAGPSLAVSTLYVRFGAT